MRKFTIDARLIKLFTSQQRRTLKRQLLESYIRDSIIPNTHMLGVHHFVALWHFVAVYT